MTMDHKIEAVNDPYGNVSDVMKRLQRLQHEGCRAAPAEPEALARWVFDWTQAAEMRSSATR